VVVQGIWSALLTLSGRFDQLFTYVVFAAWIFYAMTTSGVFVLRKKWPHVKRPYKTWGYPWIPISFILVSILFVINTLITDPRDSLLGLIIVALGVPVYLYWNFKSMED
jgi:APA family basic amino acid/polyamine antiporter